MFHILDAIIWLGFFAAIVLSIYFYLNFLHKQRMALIDKGKDILPNINIQIRFPWLKIGLIVLSMGLAFCADFLAKIFLPSGFMRGSNEELFVLCSVLIFGGIAIILGHIIDRPRTRNNG